MAQAQKKEIKNKLKIKKGDQVIVLTGKDKGAKGEEKAEAKDISKDVDEKAEKAGEKESLEHHDAPAISDEESDDEYSAGV